jgi:putative ABC transport system permease protein
VATTRAALWHYRGINLLVTLGVAVAVAVLAGALLVGRSVSTSLRDIALQRLGGADVAVSTATSFDAGLGAAMRAASPDAIRSTTALLIARGTATNPESGRMAAGVQVYGVDESFWSFHGVEPVEIEGRGAAISHGLAAELGAADGRALILRVSGPSDIPLGTLQGRRDEGGSQIRVTVARTLDGDRMGEFSLVPGQGPGLAVFVPLTLLQRELTLTGRVNTILVQQAPRADMATGQTTAAVERAWLSAATLADHGVALRRVPGDRVVALEGRGGFIGPDVAARVQSTLTRLGRPGVPALTYVASSIRVGDRVVPYSTVTAIDVDAYHRLSIPSGPPAPGTGPSGAGDQVIRGNLDVRVGARGSRVTRFSVQAPGPQAPASASDKPAESSGPVVPSTHGTIWLNEWAASDLGASVGDTVSLDYLVWTDDGGLEDRTASFALQGIAPMMRIGGDRTLTPDYPGITDATGLAAWDPPFPVDVSRVRPTDEAYWDQWRASPKAIVPLETGQALWGTRFGDVSSIRFALQDADAVTAAVRSEMSGQVIVRPVRVEALASSSGTTDFGEYFLYFSFFLVVSALLIAYLFFALGVEQRAREVGVLAAMGFTPADIRRGFLREGLVLVAVGAAIGASGAVAYAALIMLGLRTWWVDAVGTTALRLHVDPAALVTGVLGAAAAAFVALWLGTRALSRRSPRSLIHGASGATPSTASSRTPAIAALALLALAAALIVAAASGAVSAVAGFFAAGGAVLVAGLLLARALLAGPRDSKARSSRDLSSVWRLGGTHAAWRPTRTVLTLSLIAFATFVLVSVAAFRRDGTATSLEPTGGVGGYVLMAEAATPLMHDPNSAEGRAELGLDDLPSLDGMTVARMRLRPGDEASCLTLYQPRNPRILGVNPASVAGRFSFAGTTADPGWKLLDLTFDDGAIPAIADQTTLTYVFHLKVGDTFEFAPDGVTPIRFRIVAALVDSVLQSELIIGEAAFVRLFPRHEGYGVWLVEAPEARAAEVAAVLEDRLAHYGVDVVDTRSRLAAYHQVENTYLSTFQALGGLGLLLGTFGVGAVLARNVLERQREWGLLRAVGYGPRHLATLVLAESATLVAGGVALGSLAAALAIAPALVERAQSVPLGAMSLVLGAVVVFGLAASLLALRMVTRVPVVGAIKNE